MSFAAKVAAFRRAFAPARRARREAAAADRRRGEEARQTRNAVLRAQIAEHKRAEEIGKSVNRSVRAEKARRKNLPGSAECCLNWYPRGCGWTRCHTCGKPLVFTNESARR